MDTQQQVWRGGGLLRKLEIFLLEHTESEDYYFRLKSCECCICRQSCIWGDAYNAVNHHALRIPACIIMCGLKGFTAICSFSSFSYSTILVKMVICRIWFVIVTFRRWLHWYVFWDLYSDSPMHAPPLKQTRKRCYFEIKQLFCSSFQNGKKHIAVLPRLHQVANADSLQQ